MALEGVLQQYNRQGRLLQELLASHRLTAEREERVSSSLHLLRLWEPPPPPVI